ncbi:hypothetical protein B0J18DRAFT_136182 [Chaetomium sp. MPI-SDFR-AT-0129]|nr:hypothetical protein B0J18DRAFT_136182 [Chaetomium sp. MPI-SDFR-AT-0129]
MSLATAHIRIARPTNNLSSLTHFYQTGLGFTPLGAFQDHAGFSGIVLGHPTLAAYQLEFTHHQTGAPVGRAPTQDNLLVFYLPDGEEFARATRRMEEEAGLEPVKSYNPYWDGVGRTYEDPDGWRVVLANMKAPFVGGN